MKVDPDRGSVGLQMIGVGKGVSATSTGMWQVVAAMKKKQPTSLGSGLLAKSTAAVS